MKTSLAAALSILGATLPFSISAQTVVYDNTANQLSNIHSVGVEYGDQIVLAGDSSLRTATSFELTYYSSFAAAGAGVIRLYANDGAPVSGFSTTLNSPGTLLYQSASFDIIKSDESNPNNVIGTKVTVNLAGTGLVVPDTLTWTISIAGASDVAKAGVLVSDPPTVGSSGGLFWEKDGGNWALKDLENNVNGNFSAKLTAVPEPGTVALGVIGVGWLALAGYRRSRK